MSNEYDAGREARLKRAREELTGVDAAPRLRAALAELRATVAEGRRRAEVDGPVGEKRMDVQALAVQGSNGSWTFSTVQSCFPGQDGTISETDRNEKLTACHFRWAIVEAMVRARYCRLDAAKHAVANAQYTIARVPYVRIQSGAGGK